MKDQSKTKQVLIQELVSLRQRIAELEQSQSKRERLEEALWESEEELRLTLDATTDGIYKWNFKTKVLFFSPRYYTILGYDPGEFPATYETWKSLIHPDDLAGALRVAEDYLVSKPDRYENEFRMRAKAGGYRWIHARSTVVERDEHGDAVMIIGNHTDITERKCAEDALRESEERYRHLYERAPFGIGMATLDGKVLAANRMMELITGFSDEDFKVINLVDTYVNPNDRAELLETLKTSGSVADYPALLRRKDGTAYNASLTIGIVNIAGKNVLQTLVQDITARKRAEETLQVSEERYRMIFNNSPLGIVHFDANGTIIDFNDKFVQIMGAPREKIIGFHTLEMLRDPAMLKVIKDALDGILGHYEGEYLSVTGGKTTPMRAFSQSILTEDGKFLGAVGIFEDITERKQAEAEMERYRDFIENVEDACFELDLLGNLIFYNESFLKLTGYTYDEYMALSRWDRQPTREEVKRAVKVYNDVYRTGIPAKRIEFRSLRKDGVIIDIERSISLIRDKSGSPVGFRCVGRDITDRKQAEEALKQSHDQLRALTVRLQEIREETRTAMSHDLHDDVGGNLAGLKMDLLRLEKIVSKVSGEEQRNALMEVSHQAKELINKTILSARRIMMEQRPAVLDDFGLMAALEWQAGEFKTHTGISCQLVAQQQEVDLGKQAATAIFRIFQEALANVARHSGATEVIVRLSSDPEMLVLEVTDNGRGITEEQLSAKGSLGLLGIRERVLVLGGSIQFIGESGKGTTVTLRVPMGCEG